MIYEHDLFFINCIPKTGSKSSIHWCESNGLKIVNQIDHSKPIFATMRDNRDRIISGISEDLYYVTKQKYNLQGDELFEDIEYLYKESIDNWLTNLRHPIATGQCHYANLQSYFNPKINLSLINWIHVDDLPIINQLISSIIDVNLIPMTVTLDKTHRPPKEWFYEIIKENTSAVRWIEQRIKTDHRPTYIKL